MTQATRVYSTPTTNTSAIDPTRRRFLTVAAGSSIASVGALTVAAMPAAAPGSGACAADPAFALIPAMRAAHAAHGDACDALSEAEERYGFGSAEADEVYERGGAACDASYAAAWSLATTKRASRLAQQRAIGCILHQRMLEQVARLRRHALPASKKLIGADEITAIELSRAEIKALNLKKGDIRL